ncbi:MAG: biotin--[acetyl-CoA-carboxylase] ligase [Christensenellaceae bacterium]
MKIIRLKKVGSTNDYAKKFIKKRRSATVIADMQTLGRGTKGRKFVSAYGGIYLTKLTFYDNLPTSEAFDIVVQSSMAVVKTLLAFGLKPQIKWPNDVYVGGKKIAGILTENHFSADGKSVDYSIVGIGININNPIDEELIDIATSAKQVLGKDLDKESVLMTFLFNLSGKESFETYKKYSLVIGKNIVVTEGDREYEAVACDVLSDGRLLLSDGKKLSAAEVKIRKISQ